MSKSSWTSATGSHEAYRRAGGRRKYNAYRRRRADQRLIPLAQLIAPLGEWEVALKYRKPLPRPLLPALSKSLGVHRSTVWRDFQRLRRWPSSWQYSSDTGMATVRLYGLVKISYPLNLRLAVQKWGTGT